MWQKIKEIWKRHQEKRAIEYHKKLLNFIILNSVGMMWMSYVLAWFGKETIAESLSNTVASSIVAVVIPYLITKTIENVSKYGSRINRTTKEFDLVKGSQTTEENKKEN
jgi:uncharacterized protein HemY